MNVAELTRQAVAKIGMKPVSEIKDCIEKNTTAKGVKYTTVAVALQSARKKMKPEIVINPTERNGLPPKQEEDRTIELIRAVKEAIDLAGSKERLKKIIDVL